MARPPRFPWPEFLFYIMASLMVMGILVWTVWPK
jgi:hypothetical protein